MKSVAIIAPHPDDETLGCGGTLLRHKSRGDEVHWIIATAMTTDVGFSNEAIRRRAAEIEQVARVYDFDSVHQLRFPTTTLDTVPQRHLVSAMASALGKTSPQVLYLPFPWDSHGDHKAVYAAAAACTKWFRQPSLRRILAYETLSETDAALPVPGSAFSPNVFHDISEFLGRKLEAMALYEGEMGEFPFPRSGVAIESLARVRGCAAGFEAAEAFVLLREWD